MNRLLQDSLLFGFVLSLLAYWIGLLIQKRIKLTICNPMLISIVFVIVFLKVFHIDYETYEKGANHLSFLLTPTTVCLAVPLYRKVHILKKHLKAILVSIFAGCISCIGVIAGLRILFHLDETIYASLLPKSVTTAIAVGVSEEIGGISSVTVMAVVITGIFGALIADKLCKLFAITHPIAQGLACGTGAHAMGTTKAMEMGEVQGAMSSLAIVVMGLFTVVICPLVI